MRCITNRGIAVFAVAAAMAGTLAADPLCTFSLGPVSAAPAAAAASGLTVSVTASNPSCTWTAAGSRSWLTVATGSLTGTGTGTVTWNVAANPTNSPRSGFLIIGNVAFKVVQAASGTAISTPTPAIVLPADILPPERSPAAQPLLFPFVSSQAGYDAEITISNTSPGTSPQSGICTINYYGSGAPFPSQQSSGDIAAGGQLVFNLSQGGGGLAPAPGFQGYVIADCSFPLATGVARIFVNNVFAHAQAAQPISLPRTTADSQNLLFSFATDQSGFDTTMSIANTTADPFDTKTRLTPKAGACTLNFFGSGAPQPVTTPSIPAGTVYTKRLSDIAAGFEGYVTAQCNFGAAAGFASLTKGGLSLAETAEPVSLPRVTTVQPLIFTGVSNQNGQDTRIVIANTSSDPFGTFTDSQPSGTCTLSFFGANAPPQPVTTLNIPFGAVSTQVVSDIAPGFQGYVTASCQFPQARGFSYVTNTATVDGDALPAEVLTAAERGSTVAPLLFSAVSNWNGNDTKIRIANTSKDSFDTSPVAGTCTINYFGGQSDVIGIPSIAHQNATGNRSFLSGRQNLGSGGLSPQTSVSIAAGDELTFSLSQGNPTQGIAGAPGFRGYIIANCTFPLARGSATVTGNPSGATAAVTLATSPTGLYVGVDSVSYIAPETFSWISGSSHNLNVPAQPGTTAGSSYVFSSWSQDGANSQTVTGPSSNATLTATLTRQFTLTTSSLPAGGGTVTGAGTYAEGSSVQVTATPSAGYTFAGFSGDFSGTATPASVTMDAAKSIVANFAALPVVSSIRNAYSSSAPPLAPGSIASLLGSSLASSSGSISSLPAPLTLAGVSVTINGYAAPLMSVSPGQIDLQIPYEVTPGNATVAVTRNGLQSAAVTFAVAATAPGIKNVTNVANSSANSVSNPAVPGAPIIVYFTGQGAVNPAVADGAAGPSSPLSMVSAASSATINGIAVPLSFVGLAPLTLGIAQANFTVPASLAAGTYPLILTVGGASTAPTNFFVAPAPLAISSAANLGTLPIGTVQLPLTATSGSGSSFAWSVTAGSLPPGIALRTDIPGTFGSAASAGLLGVATTPGTYAFTLSVTDGSQTVTQAETLKITGLNVQDVYLPDGFANTPYSYTFTALNNAGPAAFALNSDPPYQMTLSSGGVFSGTPSEPGHYSISFTLSDGSSTISRVFAWNVSAVNITTAGQLPNATQAVAYTTTLAASGGPAPITFSIAEPLPAGLSLSADTISGSPTGTAGTYYLSVTARDANGNSSTKPMALTVIGAPPALTRIVAGNTDDLVLGNPYQMSFHVCCGGTAPFTWTAAGLPAGLSIRSGSGTGELGGVPQTAGNFNAQLTVTDAAGATTSQTIPLHVSVLDHSPTLPGGTLGTGYSSTLRILGGTPPYSVTQPAGFSPLANGLVLRSASSSGTGCAAYPSPFTPFSSVSYVTAPNGAGDQLLVGTINLSSLSSVPQPTSVDQQFCGLSTLATGFAEVAYVPTAAERSGDFSAFTGLLLDPLTNTAFPGGIIPTPRLGALFAWRINATAGKVSGTPLENGTFTPTFQYTDSVGNTLKKTDAFYIAGAAGGGVTISDSYDLGQARLGAAYARQLSAAGASAYVWSLASGTLPTGVTISSGGLLSGTPTVPGKYTFLIQATDTASSVSPGFRQFTLNVTPLVITSGILPYGNTGTAYNASLTATGGTGTLTWTLNSGNLLPPGLTLVANGAIGGTPVSTGQFGFSVTVTDSAGNTATFFYPVSIYAAGAAPPLFLNLSQSVTIPIGTQRYQLQATGGTPPYHYSPTPGAAPVPGFRVQDRQPLPTSFPASATGIGGFLGLATTAGAWNTSVRVTDSVGATFDRTTSVTVIPLTLLDQFSLPRATVGSAYSYTFTPSGGSGYVFSATGLPPGFSLNAATGVLSAASPAIAGSFPVSVAITTGGPTVTFGFTLTVNAFAITDAGMLPQGTVSTPYSHTFSAPGCVNCVWSAGVLPGGFSMTAAGVFSGSTESTSGLNTSFTVTATGTSATVSKVFALAIPPSSLQGLSIATGITTSIAVGSTAATLLSATGGTPPYSWTLQSGPLPAGISIQGPGENLAASLVPGGSYLAGRALLAGTYTFTLQVTDAASRNATKTFTWVFSPMSLEYTSLPLAGSTLVSGAAIPEPGQPLLVIGGSGVYTSWTTASNPVYPGLTLNADNGVIKGTPTNTGSATQVLSVTDSAGNTLAGNLMIAAMSNDFVTVSLSAPAGGSVAPLGFATNFNITPFGGTAPYTIAAVTDLPAGFVVLSGNSLTTSFTTGAYVLQAFPQTSGTYTFTLQATDANHVSGRKTYTIVVPDFTYPATTTLPDGSVSVAYSQQIYSFANGATVNFGVAAGSALPPGLSLSAGGSLNGTPTQAGVYAFTVNISDASGTFSPSFQLRVSSVALTSDQVLPSATTGVPYTFAMTSTGGAGTVTWSALNLPPGLSMSAAGAISGTTRATPQRFLVTVTATDGVTPVSRVFALFVRTPIPNQLSISLNPLPDTVAGDIYNTSLVPAGGVGPYTVTLAPGSTLPPGLNLVPTASLANGSPGISSNLFGQVTTAGTYTFSLVFTDTAGIAITRVYSLHVSTINLATGNLRTAVAGLPYTAQIVASGGVAPYTYSMDPIGLAQEMLPYGVAMSADGIVSGTPNSTGNYIFSVTARDSAGNTFTRQISLLCTNALGLYVDNVNDVFEATGIGTNQTFVTGGGSSTYTWSLVSGNMPPGLSLGVSGGATFLSGQPTLEGTYTYTLRATDDANSANFADHIFTETVSALQIVSPLTRSISGLVLPAANVGVPYSQTLSVAGGTPSYIFTESPFDPLPAGLTLSPAGLLSGTPAVSGVFTVRPIVTDGALIGIPGGVGVPGVLSSRLNFDSAPNRLVSPGYQLVVPDNRAAPLLLRTITGISDASAGKPYALALDRLISGGTAPYTWTATGLPAGLAIAGGSNGIGSYLTGAATALGSYSPAFTVSDSAGQSFPFTLPFVVSPLALTPDAIPNGTTGSPFSFSFVPSGGTGPYTLSYAKTSFDFPAGLTLSPDGSLSGTPTSPGNFVVGLTLTDSAGHTLNKAVEFTIDNPAGQAPALSLSPRPVTAGFPVGTPSPVTLNVASSSGALVFNATVSGIPGATLSAVTGTTPAVTTLNFDASLPAGTYTGVVAAQSANSANYGDAVPVLVTVSALQTCITTLGSSPGSPTFGQNLTLTATVSCAGATGTVTLLDGSTPLGLTADLSNGIAVIHTAALTPGAHSLTAVYSGDTNNATSTSSGVNVTVTKAPTAIFVSSSANPSAPGQSVTLTATVSPASATGTVTFRDGANTFPAALIEGMATLVTADLSIGAHSITATYGGDTNDATSTSESFLQTVRSASTTTVLTSSANPVTLGQSLTLTATVSSAMATGTVTFQDGDKVLGTKTLSGGVAIFDTTDLPPGTRSLTAVYGGDTTDSGSTSEALVQTVRHLLFSDNFDGTASALWGNEFGSWTAAGGVYNPANGSITPNTRSLLPYPLTNFTVHLETTSSGDGGIWLRAVDNPASSIGVDGVILVFRPAIGDVYFQLSQDGNYSETFGHTELANQPHSFDVVVSGNNYTLYADGAEKPLTTFTTDLFPKGQTGLYDLAPLGFDNFVLYDSANPSTTTISSSLNSSAFGQSVTFTATVAPPDATGTVTFRDGATTLGTVDLANGSATYTALGLSVGSHAVTALYGGDSVYSPGISPAVGQSVNSGTSATSLSSSPNPAVAGQAVTLTATVTPAGATGSVIFRNGEALLDSAPVVNGVATLSTSALGAGVWSLSARYSGDTTYSASVSPAIQQTVVQLSTSTSLTSSANPSSFGQEISLTATVTPPTAAGTVIFRDGDAMLGTGVLIRGTATLAVSLPAATHMLTAMYAGDANDAVSTSAALTQTVNSLGTTTTLTSSTNPATLGQNITLTATVSPAASTGTVTFKDADTTLGTGTLSNGIATFSTSALTVGSHSLTAVFGGDTDDAASTSAPLAQTVRHLIFSDNFDATASPLWNNEFGSWSAANGVYNASGAPARSLLPYPLTDFSVHVDTTVSGDGGVWLRANGGDGVLLALRPSAGAVFFQVVQGGSYGDPVGQADLGNQPHTFEIVVSGSDYTVFADGSASPLTTLHSAAFPGGQTGLAEVTPLGFDNYAIYDTALPTTATVTSSLNPAAFGQSVTFTATVTPSAATGNVIFRDGSTTLGTGALSGGVATFATPSLPVGAHAVTALYGGDPGYSVTLSPAIAQTVNSGTSTTSFSSSPNPSVFGQAVTLTATVTPADATGTVTFGSDSTALGSVPVVNGVATFSIPALNAGAHSLAAMYSGDVRYLSSVAPGVTQTVTQFPTATSLTSSANPSSFGQNIALSATVAPSTATGTVTFRDGANTLGTAAVSNGTATLNISLSTATHVLTAIYGGDSNAAPSISATFSQTVNPVSTSTTLTSSVNPATYGQNVTLSAIVTPSTATGTVTFKDGASVLGTGTLNNGTATFSADALLAGPHSLTAAYSGDINDAQSTSSVLTETVTQAVSSTSLVSGPNPSVFAQTVALTATVTPASATGSVSFKDGATTLGTGALSNGTATFSTSSLSVAPHSLTASYGGDANHAASISPALPQTVNQLPTATTLLAAPNPSAFGQSVTLTASVTPVSVNGTVTFKDGANVLGTGALSNGTASFSASSLLAGTHSLTAVYSGDTNSLASTSAAASQTVNQGSTTISLSSGNNPSLFGHGVTLTATITPATATGSVTFKDGATTLGTGTLSDGTATFTTPALSVGAHTLTAVYGGDANDLTSASTPLAQTVNQEVTSTSLTSSPSTSAFGQSITLTARVVPSTATGTVTFRDGATTLGTGALSDGSASFTTSALSAAVHSITAVYAGDTNDAGSTSSVLSQTVNPGATTTTLISSANPATFGQSVTLTATVSPAAATGTVTFKDGETTLGTGALSNGVATLGISTLSVAAHSLTAVYSGDTNDTASTSVTLQQTINSAVTGATLSSSANPAIFGQSIMLTAALTPATATGVITFKENETSLGTATLSNGIATLAISTLSAGSHSLTAIYPGDTNDAPGASTPLTQSVTQAQTTTLLTSSPNPSLAGQSVTITAAITPASATGSITFLDGTAALGTVPLVNGTAALPVSTLAPGAHNLNASYSGDSSYLPAATLLSAPALTFSSAIPGTIADTAGLGTGFTTRLPGTGASLPASDPNLTLDTAARTLAWRTTPASPDGAVGLDTGDFIGLPLAGDDFSVSATFRNVQFGQNSDQFGLFAGTSASSLFRGGVIFSGEAAAFTAHTLGAADQNTQTSSSLAPRNGDDVTLTLSRTAGTWALTLQNLTTPANSGPLPLVQPAFLNGTPGLIAGLFASNAGNAVARTETIGSFLFNGGVQTVHQITTTTSVTSSPNPSLLGQMVTLTATVTPAATGTVTFKDGETILGTGTLTAGVATYQTAALTLGAHPLTAVYSGDAVNAGSTSPVFTHAINQAPTATTLTSSLNPSAFSQNVTFTATVSRPDATGTVTFTDGSVTLGSATLSGGTATFSSAGLTAGQHSLIAAYAGDTTNVASRSGALLQTVNQAVSATTLTSSTNPFVVGQTLTLRAAVTPLSATGTVTFRDGSTTLGSAPLSEGFATLSTSLAFGPHSLTATYGGDPNHAASTSPALGQTAAYTPLAITTSGLPPGQAGQPYGPAGLSATGGSGLYSWSAGGLPQGISLSSSGSLSGSAAEAFNGSVTVTVTDGISNTTASATYTLSITAMPLLLSGPASLGSVVAGAAVSGAFRATGGKPPYTWSVTGAPGLSIDAGGNVGGTAGIGSFTAVVTVTDALNASVSRTAAFSGFGITSGGLPPASTTSDYSASLAAAGGSPPYTFTASGLPAGITFANGVFGGRPLNPGSAALAVQARDAAGLTVSANYTLTVTGPTALKIFSSALGDATVGQPYSDALGASGGAAPYTWSQSGGLLPAGLSLSASGAVTGQATAPGAYSLGVQVMDAAGTRVVGTVSVNVKPAPLTITSGAAFPSGVVGADYPAQILTAAGGVPPYTFSVRGSLPAGLSLSNSQIGGTPAAAAVDGGFTLAVADSAQPPATGLLGVSLSIRPLSPDLVVAAGSASFEITSGTAITPSPASIGVSSSVSSSILDFSTSASVPWLTVSGGSTAPGVVSIGLNAAALALTPTGSPYSGSVTVTCTSAVCAGKSQSIAVTLAVSAPPPQLSLGATLLSFAALASSPQASTASLTLVNSGGGALKINSVTSDAGWLTVGGFPATVMPGPGSGVNVTADPSGLAPGYYRGTISVASSGGSTSAAVTLFISAAATMSLGPAGTQYVMPQGGILGNASGSFSVSASTGATVPYTGAALGGASWLSVTGGSGTATSANSGTVGYTIDPAAAAALPAGAYYGTIRVSGAGVVNSPQDFQVVLSVTPATTPVLPDPQPAGLVFVSTGDGALAPQTINVYASSRTPLPFQASVGTDDGGGWLSISPAQGSASATSPGAVIVSADASGLKAGAYRGTVSFAFGSSVRAVNVTLIAEPPQGTPSTASTLVSDARGKPAAAGPVCPNALLVPTQTGLVTNFSTPTAWPTQLAVKLFDTCGSIVGNGQVVATFTNGDPPLPLTAVNTGSGLYSGTWTPRKTSSAVTITANVMASGYPAAAIKIGGQVSPNSAPVLAPNATGDVFYPQVGAGLGPGNIVQIYGSGLASQTSSPTTLPLPTAMSGTSVIIGGIPSPLFYVSPGQINAQIPFELTAGNQYQLIVSANGALTTPQPIQLNGGTPSILNFSSGAVVAQHLDGTLILDSSPAAPGEFVIIYSSGLGLTDIPVASGAASPSDPPARVADPPVLTLNGNPINLLFAGLTPGLVGLYQVNFQVPADITTGNYDLALTQSGTPSNKGVLAIKQ